MIEYNINKNFNIFEINLENWEKIWFSFKNPTWGQAIKKFGNQVEAQYFIDSGYYDKVKQMAVMRYHIDTNYEDMPPLICNKCNLNTHKGGKKWEEKQPTIFLCKCEINNTIEPFRMETSSSLPTIIEENIHSEKRRRISL